MQPTIWHNPRCSKSRETLSLLRDRGFEPVIVEYLKATPSADEIGRVLDLLGLEPRGLMRRKEAAYREKALDSDALDRDALIAAMVTHPKLIERPVVLYNGKAAIGRPPEAVLDIF